jgi:hypothetical protein
MEAPATILRSVTLIEVFPGVLDLGTSAAATGFLRPLAVCCATSEVISCTLSLPNALFNPIAVWSARALAEEIGTHHESLAKEPVAMVRDICISALRICSDGTCGSYADLIDSPFEHRYAYWGCRPPWPTLARSYVDAPRSFAILRAARDNAMNTCRETNSLRTRTPCTFNEAALRPTRASRRGKADRYIHELVVDFGKFRNTFLGPKRARVAVT